MSHLAAQAVRFAHLLRTAGLKLGPQQSLSALRVLEALDLENRDQVFYGLRSALVQRVEDYGLFEQAFSLFWRQPKDQGQSPGTKAADGGNPKGANLDQRLAEAWAQQNPSAVHQQEEQAAELEMDASRSASAREVLRQKDFEQMSVNELDQAKAMLRELELPRQEVISRRWKPSDRGTRVDLRATLKKSLPTQGIPLKLARKSRRARRLPLICICDISGSVDAYSRIFLHFMHSLGQQQDRVHHFVFATQLTNITRTLHRRDLDQALAELGSYVSDWSGGTRLGEAIGRFNREWARRVLAQGGTVLLMTDGLDRDAGRGLTRQMERLQKSCSRLLWLNPLLRWDGFEPKSSGNRAMLPYVDGLVPVHNIQSLADLGERLSALPKKLSAIEKAPHHGDLNRAQSKGGLAPTLESTL